MTNIIYKIAPNGDTVIVLTNPIIEFAIWDDVESKGLVPGLSVEEPAVEEPAESGASEITKEIQYHVSSSHLRLASPKFESMLSGEKWKESRPDENDGYYHISAEDWDQEAFLIFLNVLHLRNSQVPRSVSLDLLAKIAVLADHYNCLEAVQISTEMWIKDLKNSMPIPSEHCRDLMLWLCIAWVLRLPEEFTQMTATAIRQSRQQELSTLGLPITRCVDRIDQARIEAIGSVVSQLHDLLDGYRRADYHCPSSDHDFECGSILFGALTKGLDSAGLLVPYPVEPFPGMTFGETCLKIHDIRSPSWYNSGFRRPSQNMCNLKRNVVEIADRVTRGVQGLDLKDFGRT